MWKCCALNFIICSIHLMSLLEISRLPSPFFSIPLVSLSKKIHVSLYLKLDPAHLSLMTSLSFLFLFCCCDFFTCLDLPCCLSIPLIFLSFFLYFHDFSVLGHQAQVSHRVEGMEQWVCCGVVGLLWGQWVIFMFLWNVRSYMGKMEISRKS